MFSFTKGQMPTAESALPGRDTPITISQTHAVLNTSVMPPYPEGTEQLVLGLGCFWGAEKCFWGLKGVVTTAVGYSAGFTPNATYEEVCSGRTGHNEVVLIVYRPEVISATTLLRTFWESHNPTQGMQQGNDSGTQYRSGIYYFNEGQQALAESTKSQYQITLTEKMDREICITTEICPVSTFYFAEAYHQQYLATNPNGYCGLGGLGVCLPDMEGL
ncbi:MAG: peptide-methionine (S)-S-oxide reductase [Candidatus Endobugula sp.]|jgi:peptide-methionine (S)-S-oxide reductase